MLACHASQRSTGCSSNTEWTEIPRDAGELGRTARRSEINVAQAESFRQYRGHPYPQDNLLLELLGQDGRGKPDK